MLYLSQILNFKRKNSDMLIYIRKELKSKKFLKKNQFSYIKRDIFFRSIGLLTYLGVANFRVTLRDCEQIFLKKATIYENDMNFYFLFFVVFFFSLS